MRPGCGRWARARLRETGSWCAARRRGRRRTGTRRGGGQAVAAHSGGPWRRGRRSRLVNGRAQRVSTRRGLASHACRGPLPPRPLRETTTVMRRRMHHEQSKRQSHRHYYYELLDLDDGMRGFQCLGSNPTEEEEEVAYLRIAGGSASTVERCRRCRRLGRKAVSMPEHHPGAASGQWCYSSSGAARNRRTWWA